MTTENTEQNKAPKFVHIGCRLPHGIVLEITAKGKDPKRVEVKGLNKSRIIGAPYCTTPVDADFAEEWFKRNAKFPAVVSGALFMHEEFASVEAIAEENAKRRTGFEKMPQDAMGVKKATQD